MVVLYGVLFHNFGLAIIVLTLLVRLVTMPLTLKQLKSTRKMQELQPKLTEIQKKYAKNKEKLAQEQMKLYKESGISPLGCIIPMLIQMPIWVALYQSIIRALAVTPEALSDLSGHLYSWPIVNELSPLTSHFLWINLAVPDGTMLLPILVGVSMWVQQKMVSTPSPDPRQQSMTSMMQWMLPLMFVLISLQFPAGLAVYWLFSNILGIAIQYIAIGGWGSLEPVAQMFKRKPKEKPQAAKGK
jgi:YidC/Oxa1 family membrane protein insertase